MLKEQVNHDNHGLECLKGSIKYEWQAYSFSSLFTLDVAT